jgi:hypothetical protein
LHNDWIIEIKEIILFFTSLIVAVGYVLFAVESQNLIDSRFLASLNKDKCLQHHPIHDPCCIHCVDIKLKKKRE